ncbi:hypothetical protein ACWGB8_12055 [Kitasatospora sp. NPDC054939]
MDVTAVDAHSPDPDLQIRFVTPLAFHEVPVLGTEDEVAEQLWELVCEVLPSEPDETRMGWAMLLSELIPPMAGAGVIYAGLCLTEVEGRASTASVVASVQPLGGVRPEEAVERSVAALATARPDAEVTTVDLPAGRAAVLVDAVQNRVAGELLSTSVIQVHLPLPNGRQLLSMELSTPCTQDWELYSELFADLVRSIHLEFADLPTGPAANPAAVAAGAAGDQAGNGPGDGAAARPPAGLGLRRSDTPDGRVRAAFG